MRIVLDTNVLMSGIFWSGPPARILEAWPEGSFDLLASLEILAEYRRVGKRLGEPVLLPANACDDPDDVKFLACAIVGKAACVVSGDRTLLNASGYVGIEVVKPRGFLERFIDK